MKQLVDKIEALEDVVQQLVILVTEIKKQEPVKPKITLPNYKHEFEALNAKLDHSSTKDLFKRLDFISTQIEKVKPPKFEFKQFRFLLFPETNQGQYYKIVFGRLIPWGIFFCLINYLFSLGNNFLEMQKIKKYNNQAQHYIKAWQYLDSCSYNKTDRKKMDIAWKKSNKII